MRTNVVEFPERTTLASFEAIVRRHGQRRGDDGPVEFDLRNCRWIGGYPAVLLFAWSRALTEAGRTVEVMLPPRERLSPQVAKVLLQSDTLGQLASLGVRVPYSVSSQAPEGVSLSTLADKTDLGRVLSDAKKRLLGDGRVSAAEATAIQSTLDTVLFELGENAFLHSGGSAPYYQVSIATASGPSEHDESSHAIVGVFAPGTRYVEIHLGDTGNGIDTTLRRFVPDAYQPTDRDGRRLPRAERVLAYAFEFSSTSDRNGRQKRIQELLTNEALDPSAVATGLYCVASTARAYGGQLVVRTPSGLLSFDHLRSSGSPIVTTGARLRRLWRRRTNESEKEVRGRIPGSHFWLRIPLARSAENAIETRAQPALFAFPERIRVCSTTDWVREGSLLSEAEIVTGALENIDASLGVNPEHTDAVIALPVLKPLSSRANAVLGAAMQEMARKRRVVWADDRWIGLVRDAGSVGANPLSQNDDLLGTDFLTNRFVVPGRLVKSTRSEQADDTAVVRLPDAAFVQLSNRYFMAVAELLRRRLHDPDVRQAGGAFFFGSYYTDFYFDIRRALSQFRFADLAAAWFANTIVNNGNEVPSVVIGASPAVGHLVEAVAKAIERTTGRTVKAIASAHSVGPAWVIGQLLQHKGCSALLLADVICTGRTTKRLLGAAAGLATMQAACLIDGRPDGEAPNALWVPANRAATPLTALERIAIATHEQPRASFRDTPTEERIIYVVRQEEGITTPFAFALAPHLSTDEVIADVIPKSQALISRHIEHEGRHYSHFLNLHRLFGYLRPRLTSWLHEHIRDFVATSAPDVGGELHCRLFDPHDSLPWLSAAAIGLETVPRSFETLRSLPPRRVAPAQQDVSRARLWVIVVPTIESGAIARGLIDWAAAEGASHVLMLYLVSRMTPEDLAFLQRVTAYRDHTLLSSAHFMEFRSGAPATDRNNCPSCGAQREFERLATVAYRTLGDSAELTRLFRAKASQLRPLPSAEVLMDEQQLPSPTDIERAQLGAYLRSGQAIANTASAFAAFREITGFTGEVERLYLQMLSAENPGGMPVPAPPGGHLNRDREMLEAAIGETMQDALPPLPIGRLAAAMCSLDRSTFLEGAPSLLERFALSPRDVEEVLAILLLHGELPAALRGVNERLQAEPDAAETRRLLSQALEVGRALLRDASLEAPREFVRHVCILQAELARSSQFNGAFGQLENAIESGQWNSVQRAIRHLHEAWDRGPHAILLKLQATERWYRLEESAGESNFRLDLSHSIGQLWRLQSSAPPRETLEELLAGAKQATSTLRRHQKALVQFLERFWVSPVHLDVFRGGALVTAAGVECPLTIDVDTSIGLTFMDIDHLNVVVSHILENWKEHGGADGKPNNFSISLQRVDGAIQLRFTDDIPKDFKEGSLGGLRTADVYCETCAARCVREPFEAGKGKALVLELQPLLDDSRRYEL